MGLDMFAYAGVISNQHDFFVNDQEQVEANEPPREIAYWRKHPNLHGWMEQLWRNKNNTHGLNDITFNGIELELTWEDLDALEMDIKNGQLPSTSGFFFGTPADDYYRVQDLEFIRNARAEIFMGLRVFYNSSW
jgi:hypothetical protein